MDEDSVLDFNFWPSFADLMLALVLILVMVLFLVTAVTAVGTVNLSQVEKNQSDMIQRITDSYGGKSKILRENVSGISITGENTNDVEISNETTLQRITFSNHVLFLSNNDKLNQRGKEVLRIVGAALKQQLPSINEIQIQGHADLDSTKKFGSNTRLAAMRAEEVLKFLQESVGIDPAEHLMSATSFGEFKPVLRSSDDIHYDQQRLRADNNTSEQKEKNRRIELLLIYRR